MTFPLRTLLLSLLVVASLAAADHDETDVRQAEEAWAKAVMAGDRGALEKALDDALIYGHASGFVESKKEYLERMRSGAQRYERVERQPGMRVSRRGDSAVTHSTMRMVGTSNGKPFDDRVMMLHVWVRQGGAWKLVGHQTAKLP